MPNIGRSLRRAIRPLWIAGLGAAAWSNRAKVQEALGQKLSPPPTPSDRQKVTVRTTVATWTEPLRRRSGTRSAQSPASTLPADMAASFVEPTVTVPSTLADTSSPSGEV